MAHAGLILLIFALWLSSAAAWAGTHPDSVSSSRISIRGDAIELRLRTELRTWHEAVPVDADLSGTLEVAELESARDKLAAYLALNLEIRPCRGDQRLQPLELSAMELEEVSRPHGSYPIYELSMQGLLPPACDGLLVQSRLFEVENPLHRDQCTIQWGDLAPVTQLLWVEDPSFLYRPDGLQADSLLLGYLRSGIEHILLGLDHLAFVIVLVLGSRSLKQLGLVSLAFTLAHSLTLAASSLGWINLPSRPVEVVIALSIAWVALVNLRSEERRLWPEALGFGLVHGLGFAGAIGSTLAAEPAKLTALIGFNLGVECGQLAAISACLFVLLAVNRGASCFAGPRLSRSISALVALLAFYWTLSRLFEP